MNAKNRQRELPSDLRVFLAEVGEAVKEYLETKHKESRKIQEAAREGEEKNESIRIFSSQ